MVFRAYFSHSYRWQQKELNHFIWKNLSSDFFFAVDPPEVDRQPMQVSHLETMMLRSRCFIAVIARRDDLGPQLCSPYQLFENALAIRARRPRLLIVSEDIDSALLGPDPDQILRFEQFDRSNEIAWLRRPENAHKLSETVVKFVADVRSIKAPEYTSSGPIGLALPPTDEYLARPLLDKFLTNKLAKPGKWLDLAGNGSESQLLRDAEECSLIVLEVRRTEFTPLDVQGLLHANFRPTIRVCRLTGDERADDLASAMRLPRDQAKWSNPHADLPLLYAGYQVGPEMRPVVFWREPEELFDAITHAVSRIRDRRTELETPRQATRYFLGLGRVPGKVFISNEKSLNTFATELRQDLEEQGVEFYHYSDPEAKHGSDPEFPTALKRRIEESAVFLALITDSYSKSRWCLMELEAALKRANEGRLIVLPFLLDATAEIPDIISYLDAPHLYDYLRDAAEQPKAVDAIVAETLRALDSNQRLQISAEENRILAKLRDRALDNWQDRLRSFMVEAKVPPVDIEAVLQPAGSAAVDAARAWERLIDVARRSYRAANALGLLLVTLAAEKREVDDDGPDLDREIVELAQRHRLVPDVRSILKPSRARHEVGIACISTQPTAEVFQGIKDLKLVGQEATSTQIDETLFSSLVRVAGTSDLWPRIVVDVAAALQRLQVVVEADKRVDKLTTSGQLIGRDAIGICILGDERGLQIPFEWHRRSGSSAPICLEQPVRRFQTGVANLRSTLRSFLLGAQIRPLRALLIGNDAGGVPKVEIEATNVGQRLAERFRELRWPTGEENIQVLTGPLEEKELEARISYGGFDILHIAAHGDIKDDTPGLNLKGPGGSYFVSADRLRTWVSKSELRFVYLGSCRGAAPDAKHEGGPVRRFDNLVQAFVKGSVPEVLGFLWPIGDSESSRFAASFYAKFRTDFRAGPALLEARQSFQTSEQIWAAPILYSQSDTQFI